LRGKLTSDDGVKSAFVLILSAPVGADGPFLRGR
jgi:hypothetical protein